LGYFFNEPAKSSLIGEKLPNLVTMAMTVITITILGSIINISF